MRAPTRGLIAALLMAASAAVGAQDLLVTLNNLRAGTCASQQAPGEALRAEPRLQSVAAQLARGEDLARALEAAGYRATRSQVFSLSGQLSAARLPELLAQRFCAQIGDASMSEFGAHQTATQVWVVLAAPFAPRVALSREQIADKTLSLVNAARAQARTCGDTPFPAARPVRWNAVLEEAARRHSEDMAEHSYFSHTGRDGSTPAQRVARAGYRYRATGENIASGQLTPDEAVAGWIKSPPHCANLMNGTYTEMGVAHAVNAQSRMGVYWTQLFGTPASK